MQNCLILGVAGVNKIDKIKIVVFIALRGIVAFGVIWSLIKNDWGNMGLCILTLFMLFLTTIIERKLSIDFPSGFEIIVVVFIFCALYLGSINSFYNMIWWWDIAVHTLSGLIIAALGFSLVDILNKNEKLSISLSPLFVSIFSFSFALALGVIWEIYEFTVDSLFGLNMQKSGLVDTMWDLIVNAAGALVFSIPCYFKLKRKARFGFNIKLVKKDPLPDKSKVIDIKSKELILTKSREEL